MATLFNQNALTRWALIFLLLTVAVGAFAFAGMAVAAAIVAKFLFGLFVLLFFVFLFSGASSGCPKREQRMLSGPVESACAAGSKQI